MCKRRPGIRPGTDNSWWLDANLGWDAIERLTFDPGNRWFQLFVNINRVLWRFWEEDYFFLPFWHRSPLDAANGIRGNEIFVDQVHHSELPAFRDALPEGRFSLDVIAPAGGVRDIATTLRKNAR